MFLEFKVKNSKESKCFLERNVIKIPADDNYFSDFGLEEWNCALNKKGSEPSLRTFLKTEVEDDYMSINGFKLSQREGCRNFRIALASI